MSGVGSIGSSLLQALSLGTRTGSISQGQTPPPPEEGQQSFASRLDSALQAAGVDQETADSLKEDLQAVFEEGLADGAFPPDPAQMQEAIDGVFASYGLDASEILGPPPGGGPPPSGAAGSYLDTSTQNLLEALTSLAEQKDSDTDLTELAQSFADILFGLDKEA